MKRPLFLFLTLAASLFFTACKDDDEPMPSYQIALAEVTADATGTAASVTFDDGSTFPLAQSISGLKADSTYRIQAMYLLQNGQAVFNQYAQVLAPQMAEYAEDKVKRDPVEMLTVWKGGRYINLRINIKGTATGLHYFGFNQVGIESHTNGTRTLSAELLHDQNGDSLYYSRNAYLSLPLRPLSELLRTGTDSVRLTVPTFKGKETYVFLYN